jgi:hypothetical protein
VTSWVPYQILLSESEDALGVVVVMALESARRSSRP